MTRNTFLEELKLQKIRRVNARKVLLKEGILSVDGSGEQDVEYYMYGVAKLLDRLEEMCIKGQLLMMT